MAALTAAGTRQPLVVVIDDLHWADGASLALLQFVAARLHGARVLVVGTYRPADLSLHHPLVSTLAALARQPELERIRLTGFTVAEVARFVDRGWSVGASDELAAALHARTEGNPFFLTELTKLLASEGSLGRADAVAAAEIPIGVRDVLRRRLGRLPDATNALLRVAAVAGRTFDLRVLAAASDGGDDDRTLEAVEAALVTGIVIEDPATAGRYRFAHALVQEALYDDLSGMRQARLHARLGAALERRPRDEASLSEVAQHFYRAAPAIGPDKAVGYALDAAAEAQAQLGYEAVEEHLDRALELIERMPAGPERDAQELRVQNRLALSLMMNGGLVSSPAERACDRAAELAVRLGDTRELLSSMAGLSKAAIVHGKWQVVSNLGTRMIALGDASEDDLCRAAGLFALGNSELFVGAVRDSRQHVEDAIAIARPHWEQSPDAASLWVNPLVFALAILSVGLTLSDEDGPAEVAALEAATLAESADHLFWLVGVQLCVAIGHAFAGRVAEAGAEADRCIDLGRSTALRVVVSVAAVIRTWATARLDPKPAGLARLRADLDACDAEGVRMWRPFCLGLLADGCCEAGRWEEAVAAADEGLAHCEASGERVYEAELHRLRSVALAETGRAGADAEARASLRRAVSVATAQGATVFLRRATESMGRLSISVPS
jgi:tetratricopeptide (TPR) repeat protein